jgi:tetratricopeptide (TPR) repeat protein
MSTPLHIQARLKQAFNLLNGGRAGEAKALGEQILKAAPRDANALYLMGVLTHQAGALKEAARFFEKSHAADRRNPAALGGIGIVRLDQGRYAEAVKVFEKLLETMPREPVVLNNLGVAHKGALRYDKAISAFEAAINANPRMPDAYANLGGLLAAMGESERAVSVLRRGIDRCPPDPSLWLNLVDALQSDADAGKALEALTEGLRHFPDDREMRTRKASLLVNKGEFEAARALLTALLDEDADDPAVLFDLADLVEARPEPGDETPDDLRRRGLDAHRKTGATPKPILAHRMAQASESLKDYDAAFAFYQAAQTAFRDSLRSVGKVYDRRETEREIDLLIAHFESVPVPDAGAAPPDRPVFIAGMPRTGSTLLEQVLASHPEIHGAGELMILPELISERVEARRRAGKTDSVAETIASLSPRDVDDLRDRYLAGLSDIEAAARFVTDKLPTNFINIGLIRRMFPGAVILISERHPMDVCWSIFVQKFSSDLIYDNDLGDIGHYYRQYERLSDFWRARDPAIGTVRYEDMVADLSGAVMPVLDRLELSWEPAMAKFFESDREVRTASRLQVRRPLYASSVARWRRFEDKLGPLARALGDAPARYEARSGMKKEE